jgi:hypothetical protein
MFWFKTPAKRLTELEERVAKLESDMNEKDLDWIELRARCRRLLDRTEKAAARVDKGETVLPSDGTDHAAPDGGTVTATGGFLTAHQREIQQKILRRRGGG